MLDKMKIVYVVSYMPSFEGATVGGFDWFVSADEARDWLRSMVEQEYEQDWSHDYTMRSMLVPRHYSNEQITEHLDTEMIGFRELPLPLEWVAIRNLGGAVELEDDNGK